jgi:hypothetical protein
LDFVESFAEKGCLTVERLFDPALIAAIHDEYQRQLGDRSIDRFPPHLNVGDRRAQVPIELKGPLLDPLLTAHPLLLKMIEGLLGPDPLIDSLVCVVAFSGAEDQKLHQDHHDLYPEAAARGDWLRPYAITVAVPLVDLTPETGTTRLFAGSHRLRPGPDGTPPDLGKGELPYGKRGSAYFIDYRLWHQGTANTSDEPRPVLYIVYAQHWFTDMFNFRRHARLNLARADAMAMPTAERRLFRRLAAKGAFDLTEKELMGEAGDAPTASSRT